MLLALRSAAGGRVQNRTVYGGLLGTTVCTALGRQVATKSVVQTHWATAPLTSSSGRSICRYSNLYALKSDFVTMCKNAIVYNDPSSEVTIVAKHLLRVVSTNPATYHFALE